MIYILKKRQWHLYKEIKSYNKMDCIKPNHFEYMPKKLVKLRIRVRECLTSTNIAWSVLNAEEKEMFKDFRERVIEEASEIRERYWGVHKSLFDCF